MTDAADAAAAGGFVRRRYAAWAAAHPDRIAREVRRLDAFARADDRRHECGRKLGLGIPETLVVGLTSRCNLRCPGCMSRGAYGDRTIDLPRPDLDRVLAECLDLGISWVVLVGGEPLLCEAADDLPAAWPDLFFTIFTNGRLLAADRAARFAAGPGCAFFVNIDAGEDPGGTTGGLPPGCLDALERLGAAGLFFGASLVSDRRSLARFSDPATYGSLASAGAQMAVLFDRVGSSDGSGPVDPAERAGFLAAARRAAAAADLPLFAAPEDERSAGGCGAAGRWLAYVGPDARVAPCPFFHDGSVPLTAGGLVGALGSPSFRAVRRHVEAWDPAARGCPLRADPP